MASPRNLADAVEAVIESTDVWRNLIEQAGANSREAYELDEPEPPGTPGGATFV